MIVVPFIGFVLVALAAMGFATYADMAPCQ